MSVVVSYGATDESQTALVQAREEALRRQTELHILATSPEAVANARAQVAAEGRNWHVHEAPEHQSPAHAVLDLAAETAADVIVVGTRRRSPVGKLFLGSLAQEILLAAEVPVLVVKP
jgi:nucleotide-binding universal stress UspA family protein